MHQIIDLLVPICAGSGATAVVQVARCLKNNMKVAIKRIDLERCGSTIEELQVRVPAVSVSPHSSLREEGHQ